jgi:hypothetical protein
VTASGPPDRSPTGDDGHPAAGFKPTRRNHPVLNLIKTGVNVTPNSNGLPGISELQNIVGALLTIGLIAALAGLALSASVWALGNHSANPVLSGRGKTGVLVSFLAAALTGGAVALINFFAGAGATL